MSELSQKERANSDLTVESKKPILNQYQNTILSCGKQIPHIEFTKVDEKGRIQISIFFRKLLEINKGDRISLEFSAITDNENEDPRVIILRKAND